MRSTAETDRERRVRIALGIWFATQAILGAIIRCTQDRGHEAFWLSQASYSLGAAGLLCGSSLVSTSAFCAVFVIHSLWVIDAIAGFATNTHPFGITEFARSATLLDWIVLQPHFYFAYALGAYLLATRRVHERGWLVAFVFLAVLVAISRTLLPPAANVNLAFTPIEWLEDSWLGDAWRVGTFPYLCWLIGGASLLAFLPANLALLAVCRLRRNAERSSRFTTA